MGADEHSGSLFAPNLVDGPMEGAVLGVQQDLGGGGAGLRGGFSQRAIMGSDR